MREGNVEIHLTKNNTMVKANCIKRFFKTEFCEVSIENSIDAGGTCIGDMR